MKRLALQLAASSLAVLALAVGLAAAPSAGVSVRDLAKGKADTAAAKVSAQSARDAAAKALADADSALVSATSADVSADARLAKALQKVGPQYIDGVVFEPTSDGYRTFRPGDGSDLVDTPDPTPVPTPDPTPVQPPVPAAPDQGPVTPQ